MNQHTTPTVRARIITFTPYLILTLLVLLIVGLS